MNIQAANDAQLRNFNTLIDDLQELHWNTLFFFSQKKQNGLVGEAEGLQRNARGSLFHTNNEITLGSVCAEIPQKVLGNCIVAKNKSSKIGGMLDSGAGDKRCNNIGTEQ